MDEPFTAFKESNNLINVVEHYDLLIDENNDPFRDPPVLQEYMNQWDGQIFVDSMKLTISKSVLEVGVGTGRIAAKVAPNCAHFTGIDISPKTIERAKENLSCHHNIELICADFTQYQFNHRFDVIYSTLTIMHFEDKQHFISKTASLLHHGGTFCLSIDKNQSEYINMGTRKLKIYPDTLNHIISCIHETAMHISDIHETESAYIIICIRQ